MTPAPRKPPSMPPLGSASDGASAVAVADSLLSDELGRMRRRLQWLMGGRLLAVTLLLGGFLLISPRSASNTSFTPMLLWTLIGATYGASLVFAVRLPAAAARSAKSLRLFAHLQLAWDLALATGLVYVTGGAASGFTFLYGTSILMAAVIVGPVSSYVTAAAALALYLSVGVTTSIGILPAPPDQPAARFVLTQESLGISILTNVVGLLLVTVLASSLAERLRTTGGELRKAALSAARLVRLNDEIVRSIPSGLLTSDDDGLIRAINPAGAAIIGLPAREIVGQPIQAVLPIDLQAASSGQRGEGEGLRSDGSRFPVGFTHTPLLDAEARRLGTLVIFQDLTEIFELKQAKERAERLATLGRLAAGLAHEIRNPLGSISGSVQLVRENRHLDADESRLLGLVLNEVDRLNDLVTTMLEIGKPRKPMREPVDIAQLSREVLEVLQRGQAAESKIMFVAPDAETVVAEVDPNQIRQILWNLLKNAIQATPAGGTVTLSARDVGDEVCIEVSDTGVGIDASDLERVFEMFYSGRQHGVGLGLALVRQLTEAHGGHVEVSSEERKGATFRAFFPKKT